MGAHGKGLTLSSAEPGLGPGLPALSPGFHCPPTFSQKLVLRVFYTILSCPRKFSSGLFGWRVGVARVPNRG